MCTSDVLRSGRSVHNGQFCSTLYLTLKPISFFFRRIRQKQKYIIMPYLGVAVKTNPIQTKTAKMYSLFQAKRSQNQSLQSHVLVFNVPLHHTPRAPAAPRHRPGSNRQSIIFAGLNFRAFSRTLERDTKNKGHILRKFGSFDLIVTVKLRTC